MSSKESRRVLKSKSESTVNPKTIAFFAFFPITGILGVHDILIKKYWGCILRIICVSFIILSMFDAFGIIETYIPTGHLQIFTLIFVVSPLLLTALYAWAFAEGFQILKMQQPRKDISNKNNSNPLPSSKPKAQALNTPLDAHDTLYFESNLSDGIKEKQNQEALKNEKKHAPIVSFILSSVVFSFWGSTLFIKPEKIGCTGGSGALGVLAMLVMPIYIVFAVVSIILSIGKLKSKFRGLAITSIVMVVVSIIFVVRFFIWLPTICAH